MVLYSVEEFVSPLPKNLNCASNIGTALIIFLSKSTIESNMIDKITVKKTKTEVTYIRDGKLEER